MKNVPDMLAAVDVKRNRIFVLARPNICAVRMEGVWYQSMPIPLEEVDQYYDLVTDFQTVKSLVEEAKSELNIP